MSFVIRNNPFTVHPHNAVPKRAPVTIEGEAVVEKTRPIAQDKNTTAKKHSQQTQRPEPTQTTREARLEKYDEQLLGSQRILAARSPLSAFAQSSLQAPRVGSSIDIYV